MRTPPRHIPTSTLSYAHMLHGHQTRRRLHSHVTRARHRTHARTAAAATTWVASDPRVVRRSAGRRRKAARWRADALSSPSWHEERCSVQCAGRAAARGSVSASPTASPLLAPEHSLRRTRVKPLAKDRAATGNLKLVPPARRVEATPDPRAPSGHTRTLRAEWRKLAEDQATQTPRIFVGPCFHS